MEIEGYLPSISSSERSSGFGDLKLPAGQYQIGEAEQREQLRGVLCQAAVTHFAVTEQVLHDVKRMLHLCPDARFEVLQFLKGVLKDQVQHLLL